MKLFWTRVRSALLLVTFLAASGVQAGELSFGEALSVLAGNSLTSRRDDASLEAARGREKQGKQVFLPEVSASAQQSRGGELSGPVGSERDVGLKASLNLYRFGADEAGRQVAQQAVAATEATLTAEAQKRERDGAEKLILLVGARQILELEKRFMEIKKRSVELVKRLYERGTKASQEVEKLQIELGQEEMTLQAAAVSVEDAYDEARKLADRDFEVKSEWPWKEQLRGTKAQELIVRPAGPDAERQRLSYLVAAAEAATAKARAAGMPSLDLGSRYDWQQLVETPEINRTWSVALSLTVPLYQRGQSQAGLLDQVAVREAAAVDLALYERSKPAALASARRTLTLTVKGLLTNEDLAARSRVLYETSQQAFQRGVLSVNDLSADQLRYLSVERSVIESWKRAHLAIVEVCRELGMRLGECVR